MQPWLSRHSSQRALPSRCSPREIELYSSNTCYRSSSTTMVGKNPKVTQSIKQRRRSSYIRLALYKGPSSQCCASQTQFGPRLQVLNHRGLRHTSCSKDYSLEVRVTFILVLQTEVSDGGCQSTSPVGQIDIRAHNGQLS